MSVELHIHAGDDHHVDDSLSKEDRANEVIDEKDVGRQHCDYFHAEQKIDRLFKVVFMREFGRFIRT
jgi:hypothetical protein